RLDRGVAEHELQVLQSDEQQAELGEELKRERQRPGGEAAPGEQARVAPAPATPTQMPTARPRSSSGKTFVMIERVIGMTSAAPTPMTARRPIASPGR
ncbi:MAG TPA: hypothetical protein VGJ11_08130, partial [Gaiellales bacterium]